MLSLLICLLLNLPGESGLLMAELRKIRTRVNNYYVSVPADFTSALDSDASGARLWWYFLELLLWLAKYHRLVSESMKRVS